MTALVSLARLIYAIFRQTFVCWDFHGYQVVLPVGLFLVKYRQFKKFPVTNGRTKMDSRAARKAVGRYPALEAMGDHHWPQDG